MPCGWRLPGTLGMGDGRRDTSARRDTIALRGLRIRGYHEVLAEDRGRGHDFVVDALLTGDAATPARWFTNCRSNPYGNWS